MSLKSEATELTYGFKNPSFSGVNASSHWLTIDNQESTRTKQIADDIKAALQAKAAAAQNTILAKFINNLESRIYSQLAAQLTQNLFGENPQNSGTFTLDGNTISYVKDPTGQTLTMTITDSNKNVTTITIPLTGFTF
jgi:curli production assembly/transport component CsgF